MKNLISLEKDLKVGIYRHGPYYHFKISDPKLRDIHKATVRDRIVHHALYRALYSSFAQTFIYDSYSCCLDKGTHRALRRLNQLANKASCNGSRQLWVLKGDIRKCFASVNHVILKRLLARRIKDQELLGLLDKVIDSFSSSGGDTGIPLGNLTSQLFINIYLNEFDRFVKHQLKEKYYIRYADDFVIMGSRREDLIKLIPLIDRFLTENLRLTLHPKKVVVKTFSSGTDFLGWVHFHKYRVLRTTTKRRMMEKVKEKPTREVVESYLGLLGHGNAYELAEKIRENYK